MQKLLQACQTTIVILVFTAELAVQRRLCKRGEGYGQE